MIDFSEISWEKFEDLAEELLEAEGLKIRRLGRGPGQLGKDIIALEFVGGPLSESEEKKWLVECKYTDKGSIGEKDIYNVYDRVKSQTADGYLLFTNARLRVNLERVLFGLKNNIGIDIWTKKRISEKTVLNNYLFRKYFPLSFNRWILENRLIYLNQVGLYRAPLGHVYSSLQLLNEAPDGALNPEVIESILSDVIPVLRKIIDNMDEQLKIIYRNVM